MRATRLFIAGPALAFGLALLRLSGRGGRRGSSSASVCQRTADLASRRLGCLLPQVELAGAGRGGAVALGQLLADAGAEAAFAGIALGHGASDRGHAGSKRRQREEGGTPDHAARSSCAGRA